MKNQINYTINPKNLKGDDTDLAHVVAFCLAVSDFKITEEVYKKLPEMFKTYFTKDGE